MSFTPSNLALTQLGALTLTIATCNANTVSGTDVWTSGITDIQSVIPIYQVHNETTVGASNTVFGVSWTGSSGTIHLIRGAGASSTAFQLLVLSGFATDMTW